MVTNSRYRLDPEALMKTGASTPFQAPPDPLLQLHIYPYVTEHDEFPPGVKAQLMLRNTAAASLFEPRPEEAGHDSVANWVLARSGPLPSP